MHNENQFQQAVTECLENAIVSVAEEEFDRLLKDMNRSDRAKVVYDAFIELGKLNSSYEMPDYNHELVPLLYLTWYHPSQVNLAYSIIKDYISDTSNEKLYVFDFGCGNLAMLFGVAIAELEPRMDGFHRIRVDSMDASKPMTNLGKKVWKQFNKCVQRDRRLPNLAAIDSRIINEVPSEFHQDADGRWLSALHAVYPNNCSDVKRELDKIAKSINPTAGFITTIKEKKSWAERVSPFDSWGYRDDEILRFPSNLAWRRVTNWRKELLSCLLKDASPEQMKWITQEPVWSNHTIESLLERNVTWRTGGTPYALIYSGDNQINVLEDLPW